MRITPRIYQKWSIRAALKGLRGHMKRALVVLATGLGKTLTAALITKTFCPKRMLFLVHSNFILEHARDEFRLVFGEKTVMAIFNGLSKDGAASADMVFATWQTMGKNLKLWKRDHFDLIIVDEAHHSEANTYRPVLEYFTGPRLAITATPDRGDEADIRNLFGPEVINITLEEAIARGWLPRIEYHVVTDESLDEDALQTIAAEIRESRKRFTMTEVNRRIFIRKRDEEIARIIDGYQEKSIIFCASIQHAERMRKSLRLSSVFHSATGEHGADTWKKNQKTLESLKNGTIRLVCAVNAFNEGVNVPTIGLVAFCRVTSSMTIFRQQLGRGLRPGKDKLVVLDFVGNLERVQLVLEMMNRISDLHERYSSKEERAREGYTRQRFEVSGKGFEFTFSDQVVDLMKVLEHCEREFYQTWQEAADATIQIGIGTQKEYYKKYIADCRLPSNPRLHYGNFPGWSKFLGVDHYETWQEASAAALKIGITFPEEYRKRYKEDKRLPSSPNKQYREFPGWRVFLGRKRRNYYPTWEEAAGATQKLGIKTQQEYFQRYAEDSRLNSSPHRYYKDFPGYVRFLKK